MSLEEGGTRHCLVHSRQSPYDRPPPTCPEVGAGHSPDRCAPGPPPEVPLPQKVSRARQSAPHRRLPHPQLTNGVDGPSKWQEPKAVLEHSPGMEEGQSQPHGPLEALLHSTDDRALGVGDLVEELILPEGEDRDQGSPARKQGRTLGWGGGFL